jgi:hypothetical protein
MEITGEVIRTVAASGVATILLVGCVSTWQSQDAVTPTTYQLPGSRVGRGVGNLKRLVVLPAFVEGVGDWDCARNDETFKDRFVDSSLAFLSRSKGYRVSRVKPPVQQDPDSRSLNPPLFEEYTKNLLEDTSQWGSPSTKAALAAGRIGVAFNVDGIVLLRANNGRLFFLAPTLTLQAWIFEAKTGRIVWKGQTWTPDCYRRYESVFSDLENAVPDVMVR